MAKRINTTKLVALLAVLCMITSAFVGSTLAKYTTKGEATDSARVAEWGVEITAAATQDLFTSSYATSDSDTTVTVYANTDVVAPGTKGTFSQFTVIGTPEVATELIYTPTVTLSDNWADKDGNFYCPIAITVGTDPVDTSSVTSVADYKTAIENAIKAKGAEFKVGDTLNTDLAITWEWIFDGDDEKDTYLGNLDSAPTISVDVTATINQVD